MNAEAKRLQDAADKLHGKIGGNYTWAMFETPTSTFVIRDEDTGIEKTATRPEFLGLLGDARKAAMH